MKEKPEIGISFFPAGLQSSREGERRFRIVIKVKSSPKEGSSLILAFVIGKIVHFEDVLWKIRKTRQKCYLWGYPMGLNLNAHQEWEHWWGSFQARHKCFLNASVNQSREWALCTGELPGKVSRKGVGPWDRKGGQSVDEGPLEVTSSGSSRGTRRGFSDGGLYRSTAVSHRLRAARGAMNLGHLRASAGKGLREPLRRPWEQPQ